MGELTVRAARADDAEAMGAIFVAAATAGWTEVFGPAALDALRAPARLRHLAAGAAGERLALALEDDDRLVGFAIGCRCSDDDAEDAGEVEMLYVHPSAWGQGAGQRLLDAACDALAARSFPSAVHWVAAGLPAARGLLERAGWSLDGATRTARFLDVSVPQVRYRRGLALRIR